MSSGTGPNIPTSSLRFYFDASNPKSVSGIGNARVTGANQLVKNLIRSSDSISATNTLKLGLLTYYTIVAIDYPESSNGGTFVNRAGVTPGFYVTSGTKTYDSSRALHLWVWNHDTNSWIPDSYFSGYRLNGHCYDTYAGADAPGGYSAELGRFAANFNTIKTTFTNCTYIVTGSHRDSYRNATVRALLYDIGLPTGTQLDNDYIANGEWVLIGRPGLGAGNNHTFVYENNDSTSAVAVAGFGGYSIPANYINFDGASRITFTLSSSSSETGYTRIVWVKPTTSSADMKSVMLNSIGNNSDMAVGWEAGYPAFHQYTNVGGEWTLRGGTGISINNKYMIAATVDRSSSTNNVKVYLNGILDGTGSRTIGTSNSDSVIIGGPDTDSYSGSRMYYGDLYAAMHFNRVLSADEIFQIFQAHRGRYGI